MDAVIARAMAKDREARFGTCREMIDAARSFLAGWDPATAEAAERGPAAPSPPPGSLAGSVPAANSGSPPSPPSGSLSASAPPAGPSGPLPVPPPPAVASVPSRPPPPSALSHPSAPGSIPPAVPGRSPSDSPRTPRRGSGNPLLTWILVGAGAALVVVLLLILFAK
jgi:serine/threonine-protein kinase